MRIKSLIEAKGPDIDSLLKKVQGYNNDGEQTKALIELAKFLKNKKMESVLNQVDMIGKELDNSKQVQTLRMFAAEIRIDLRKEFEKKFGREAYNKLEDVI